MNAIPDNSIIVSDITNNSVKIIIKGDASLKKVKALGFVVSDHFMVKTVKDEVEKLELLKSLVNVDAFFKFGYGWYPSEVMGLYKENGLLSGAYKIISWSDPNNYEVEEK